MSDYPYSFQAKIVPFAFGKLNYSVVYVPQKLVRQLPLDQCPRLRIDGEVNGIRVEAALMPAKGRWYMMISKKLMKFCGLRPGVTADVQFDIADQDAVTMPDELNRALEVNEQAAKTWNQLTPGKRRGLAYRIASAKLAETRERRTEETIDLLLGPLKR